MSSAPGPSCLGIAEPGSARGEVEKAAAALLLLTLTPRGDGGQPDAEDDRAEGREGDHGGDGDQQRVGHYSPSVSWLYGFVRGGITRATRPR